MTDEPMSPQAEEKQAIEAIARTPEGALLHRYLRRILETVIDLETESALRSHNGRRSLARDLMRLMAEGIDDRNSDPANRAILTRNAGPVVVARQRRDRRDLPRVDSFSDDLNPDGSAKPSSGSDAA